MREDPSGAILGGGGRIPAGPSWGMREDLQLGMWEALGLAVGELDDGPGMRRVWKGEALVLEGSQTDFVEGRFGVKAKTVICAICVTPMLGKCQSKSGKRGPLSI